MPVIIAGTGSRELAEKMSSLSGFPLLVPDVRTFPDGETYVRLEGGDFRGERVFILKSMFPRQNDSLAEMLLEVSAVKNGGGTPVAVLPYMAYSRQDRVFAAGEPVSMEVVMGSLRSAGAESVITVDPHFMRKEGTMKISGTDVRTVSAVHLLRDHFSGSVTVVGPDEGSREFLSTLGHAVFLKKRKTARETDDGKVHYDIEMDAPEIASKNVLLMDDIISSGGTMVTAAKLLKGMGKNVNIACVHGLFLGGSLRELKKYARSIVSTDTVKSECSVVSVAELLAEAISE